MELPAHLELTPAWRRIRGELRRIVGDTTFDIWLSELEAKSWDGSLLVLDAPAQKRTWISNRFKRPLERAVRAIGGDDARVAFAGEAGTRSSSGASPELAADDRNPLKQRYTFDQFIIGDGNRLAHAAALAVAELPGNAYNPLFLHAPPGLGKTHLLHAIGNFVLAFGGGTTVRYTTVETFTNHFISSLSTRSTDAFKHTYRDADVLLIDDVQFLASKVKTEEEFFHTFNSVYDSGRQLVLTCDRLPRQLIGVEERLRERFESGLVATIAPPDLATRIAIVRKRAVLDRIPIADPEVLELVATRVTDNIRALEGALIRIVAHHSLTGRPIDLALATMVLDEIHPAPASDDLTIDAIQAAVAGYYEITVDEMLSSSRAARISWPRQVAIQLSRELTDSSLNQLGTAFGGRNHATIMHSCKRVAERILNNPEAAGELDDLHHKLRHNRVDLDS